MLDAIYIISQSGLPLYFRKLKSEGKESIERATLFSGAITAIQTFLATMDVGEANYFATQTHEIYIKISKNFGVVIIKDINVAYEKEIIDKILSEIVSKIISEIQEIQEVHTGLIFSHKQEQILNGIIDAVFSIYDQRFSEMSRFSEENLAYFRAKMNAPTDVSITFLFDHIKSNLDVVIYALLSFKPIIICSDLISASQTIAILNLLTPFPFQNVITYTSSYVDPQTANVIGVPQASEINYKNADVAIISLEKGTASGLNGTKILRALVKKMRKQKTEIDIRASFEKEMSNIITKCIELLGMCSNGKFDSEQFQKFTKQTPEDLMTLVTDICIQIKPSLKQQIEKQSFFGLNF